MSDYDPHKDSLASWQQGIAAQRVHFIINRAADEFGTPLKAGCAMFITQKLIKEIPAVLEAIAQSAERGVS